MKNYEIVFWGKMPTRKFEINATDFEDAYEKADKKSEEYSDYPKITIRLMADTDSVAQKHYGNINYAGVESVQSTDSVDSFSVRNDLNPVSSMINAPKTSNWALLYRFSGGLTLFFGIILAIVVAQKNEAAAFQLIVMTIAITLSCFLFAFLIDTLTDMRHYQRQSAECLQKLLEK